MKTAKVRYLATGKGQNKRARLNVITGYGPENEIIEVEGHVDEHGAWNKERIKVERPKAKWSNEHEYIRGQVYELNEQLCGALLALGGFELVGGSPQTPVNPYSYPLREGKDGIWRHEIPAPKITVKLDDIPEPERKKPGRKPLGGDK